MGSMHFINLIGLLIIVSVLVVGALLYKGATALENQLAAEKEGAMAPDVGEPGEEVDGECEI